MLISSGMADAGADLAGDYDVLLNAFVFKLVAPQHSWSDVCDKYRAPERKNNAYTVSD